VTTSDFVMHVSPTIPGHRGPGGLYSDQVGVISTATPLTSAAALGAAAAGKSFYDLSDCFYNDINEDSLWQSYDPLLSPPDYPVAYPVGNPNARVITFDAAGNITFDNGDSFTAAEIDLALSVGGTVFPDDATATYLRAYQLPGGAIIVVHINDRNVRALIAQ
jgi:hypothetical protein